MVKKLKEETTPDSERCGILMPALSYRFKVLYGRGKDCITAQTSKVEYDLVNKTLVIEMDQPMASYNFLEELKTILDRPTTIVVQDVDGGNHVTSSHIFMVVATKHESIRDYSTNSVAKHTVWFDINTCVVKDETD